MAIPHLYGLMHGQEVLNPKRRQKFLLSNEMMSKRNPAQNHFLPSKHSKHFWSVRNFANDVQKSSVICTVLYTGSFSPYTVHIISVLLNWNTNFHRGIFRSHIFRLLCGAVNISTFRRIPSTRDLQRTLERAKNPWHRSFSCLRMRPRTLRSPRLLRRETPRKRCPGGREDARGAVCYTAWDAFRRRTKSKYRKRYKHV